MSASSWQETLNDMAADGAALTNSTVATSLTHTSFKTPNPWGQLIKRPGQVIKVTAQGRVTHLASALFTFDVRLGSTVISTAQQLTLNATAKTNVGFWLEWIFTVRSTGSAATLMPQGQFQSEAGAGAAVGATTTILLPASAPAVSAAVDLTSTSTPDIFGTWGGTASASNSILLHQAKLELLN